MRVSQNQTGTTGWGRSNPRHRCENTWGRGNTWGRYNIWH
jgi:hypothetical protein